MKANEAPEKIYVDANESWLRTFVAFTDKAKANDIEYIRTDSFIKKACEFIKERIIFDDNAWYVEGEITIKDKVIEDFKNYIKE